MKHHSCLHGLALSYTRDSAAHLGFPVLSPPQNGQLLWSDPILHTRTWQFRKSTVRLGGQGLSPEYSQSSSPSVPDSAVSDWSPAIHRGLCLQRAALTLGFMTTGGEGLGNMDLHSTHTLSGETPLPAEGPVGAVFLKDRNRGMWGRGAVGLVAVLAHKIDYY